MAEEKAPEPKEAKQPKPAEAAKGAEEEEKPLSPDAKKREKEKKEKKKGETRVVKKVDYGPDFKYIVRIANTDLDGTRTVEQAVTGIKGIGSRIGTLIVDTAGLPRREKIGKLNDSQVDVLAKTVDEIATKVPAWMVNRPFDVESGSDLHLVGANVEVILRDDLNRLKKIRSYRGVRHEAGMPVRGQRTRSHGRTGLTVGVQRAKAVEAKKEEGAAEGAPAAPKGGGGAKPLGGAKPAAAPAGGAPAAPAGGKPAAGGAKPAAAPAKPAAKPAGDKK